MANANDIRVLVSKQVLFKLFLLSSFCFAFEVVRMIATDSLNYIFLPFNLLLAWIPMLFAMLAANEERLGRKLLYLVVWLIFFPNAPYLITDLIHLKPRNDFPLWFDSILLYSFAFTGLMVGMFSALIIYSQLRRVFSSTVSKGFILLMMLGSGYGIYLGRFLRWNSWSLLTHPLSILHDTLARILHPFSYPQTYEVTIMTGLLLSIAFLLFESFTLKEEL